MTMAHRAFAFDYSKFHAELRPVLLGALETNDTTALQSFIDSNRGVLVDPDQGEPLPKNWHALLDVGDVHELGDYALTKYYDGDLDIGLDVDWEPLAELLEKSGLDPALTLGTPLGEEDAPFDPGRQGSYFQTPTEVAAAVAQLQALLQAQPALTTELLPLQGMFQQAARHRCGLYVTF
jgi:hypothetical protein